MLSNSHATVFVVYSLVHLNSFRLPVLWTNYSGNFRLIPLVKPKLRLRSFILDYGQVQILTHRV